MSEVKRAVRVAARLREELARALMDLSDPRTKGALVTRVEMSDDLQNASVFVRLERKAERAEREALLRGLESASGRLRREVTQTLGLRFSPKLRFFFDEGQDARSRVEEILIEIERERERGQGGDA